MYVLYEDNTRQNFALHNEVENMAHNDVTVSQVWHYIIPFSIIDFKIRPTLILAKFSIFLYSNTSLDALEKNIRGLRRLSNLSVRFLCILDKDIYYSNGRCHLIVTTRSTFDANYIHVGMP